MTHLHDCALVVLVSFAQLLTQSGLAQSVAPLLIIGDSFGTQDAGQLSWTTAAYSLTSGTFILLSGRLGDHYGHRRLFRLGWLVYSTASIAVGLTSYEHHTLIPLDIFRALQGVGPALLLPNGLAILARHFSNRPILGKRLAFSFFGGVAPAGFVLGSVFSSLPAQRGQWPWNFYTMGILCFLLAIASTLIIPADDFPLPKTSLKDAVWTLDLPGAAIGILGLLVFNVAWNQAPLVGWQNAQIISTLVIGLALIAVFLWYERCHAGEQALLPWHTFSRQASFVLACIAAGWSSFGIWLYYYYQQSLVVESLLPLTTSVRLVPCALSGFVAAFTTAWLLPRSRASLIMTLAMLAFFTGSILLATRESYQIYWAQIFVASIVTPWGMDMSFPASTLLLSEAMPADRQGLAGSLVTTFVNYSISIGLGIAGTVEVYTSRGGSDVQRGIRNARWSGVALASTGVCISLLFCLFEAVSSKHRKQTAKEREVEEASS